MVSRYPRDDCRRIWISYDFSEKVCTVKKIKNLIDWKLFGLFSICSDNIRLFFSFWEINMGPRKIKKPLIFEPKLQTINKIYQLIIKIWLVFGWLQFSFHCPDNSMGSHSHWILPRLKIWGRAQKFLKKPSNVTENFEISVKINFDPNWKVSHTKELSNETIPYYISIDLDRMLEADFTTGAILISFGAVLGVASPVQLIFMIVAEVVFYNVSSCKKI